MVPFDRRGIHGPVRSPSPNRMFQIPDYVETLNGDFREHKRCSVFLRTFLGSMYLVA